MILDLRNSHHLPKKLVTKVRMVADYIINHDATFEEASCEYSLSLGTVFNYMHIYLPKVSKVRYISVLRIIERHKRFKRGRGVIHEHF